MTGADNVDDQALLANTSTQAESLLRSLEQEIGGIDLSRNVNKIESMCFKHEGVISTFSGKPMKLVDQFTYLGRNILSTESDANIRLTKLWTAIDR